jgi:capsid protein
VSIAGPRILAGLAHEDRGYASANGHLILPSGQLVAVHQGRNETNGALADALIRAVWAEWEEEGNG